MRAKPRDLTVSDSVNLNGRKEFNHLSVANLYLFLREYKNNLDYYKAPFEILGDLEAQIKFENNPPMRILCSYKPDGDVIFDLIDIRIADGIRVVTYSFTGYAS